jgi:hypothetical protein
MCFLSVPGQENRSFEEGEGCEYSSLFKLNFNNLIHTHFLINLKLQIFKRTHAGKNNFLHFYN